MKKWLRITLLTLALLGTFGCSSKEQKGVSVVKTYEVTDSQQAEENFDNDQLVTMVKYYEMSDGTWKASGLSSNMDDYFDEKDAKFVAMK